MYDSANLILLLVFNWLLNPQHVGYLVEKKRSGREEFAVAESLPPRNMRARRLDVLPSFVSTRRNALVLTLLAFVW